MLYGNHKFGMQHFQVFGREVNATTYSLNAVACNYVGNLRQVNVAAYDLDASAYTNWILKLTPTQNDNATACFMETATCQNKICFSFSAVRHKLRHVCDYAAALVEYF